MTETFVVVGGDAAGLSAASKAKREDPEREVVVFEKGRWVSYAACGMPYYVKGVVPELEDLIALTPREIREDRGIDLRTEHEVVDVDSTARTVTVANGEGSFEMGYDSLLLATGAHAIEPPFEGMDLDGVFTIHGMDDAEAIRRFVAETDPATAGIVGGGYVGVEMAEALAAHDVTVHLYEMLPHVLQPFGDVVAEVVEEELRDQGVHLHLDTAVSGFEGDDRVEGVRLEDDVVPADVVIVGVGVKPNVALARAAGVELGPTGAIATDEYGRTNVEGIYAAGDCAEARHVVTGEPDYVPLALTANRSGRAIGKTVAGSPTPVGETAGTAIVKAFDLGAARTGLLEADHAREAGFDPVSTTITASSRARYYPGSADLTVTLLADGESGTLLGGSVVGAEGAKRIDTLATALHAGMTVTELQTADLAYAPPFGPAWDPILTATRVLEGELD